MSLEIRIKELIDQYGYTVKVKSRSYRGLECPKCGRSEKFYVLKQNGACVCYRGSCDFGKGWFEDWLAPVANVTREVASKMIHGTVVRGDIGSFRLNLSFDMLLEENPNYTEIKYPPENTITTYLTDNDGSYYLEKRGVTKDLREKYQIRFNPTTRRVILPVFMDGTCYGWQGRHIDNVDKGFRMRNNEGFQREHLVMFLDEIEEEGHALIFEGPFDRMPFEKIGGAIAVFGKVVTDHQMNLIKTKNPSKIYLGLDDDAFFETQQLINKLYDVEVYQLKIPKSTYERCAAQGKKADFGECTPEEALYSYQTAVRKKHFDLDLSWEM